LKKLLPDDRLAVVSIDVDESETEQQFLNHANRNQLNWRVAMASRELRQAITRELGPAAITTTSAPVIVIDRQGKATLLRFGVKGADELRRELAKFLG
jgi:hypothetical protein